MKKIMIAVMISALSLSAVSVFAQTTAGQVPLGVTQIQMNAVISGWSAKKNLIGKAVINEQNQKVGKIDDIIIAPDNAASYAVVGAGGFLGVGKHDVVIPFNQFKIQGNDFLLPGATKDQLKALPKFEYAHK
ncbi:MAG: PRC-barrel domain-containing protein [Burkholderiaceae bacterium]